LHIVIEKQNLLIIVYQFPIYETKMSSKKNDDINFNVQKFWYQLLWGEGHTLDNSHFWR